MKFDIKMNFPINLLLPLQWQIQGDVKEFQNSPKYKKKTKKKLSTYLLLYYKDTKIIKSF